MNASASRTVALLGDTHGFLDPRIAEVARSCDTIVHVGDVGDAVILDALEAAGHPLVVVAGNNDTPRHWGLEPCDDGPAAQRLAALPEAARLDLPGGPLVVVHGHRTRARDRHARLRRAHPDAAAVVHGHSHRLTVDREAVPWILNPGAAGRTRTYGGPACIVLTATSAGWTVETRRFDPQPRRSR